ncbi:MAG: PqiC family protein [Gemmatimonadaceae bacterium]
MTVRTTRLMAGTHRLFGLGALFTVTGCFSLARPTPPLERYVLGQGPSAMAAAPAHDTGGITIGLRRLDLAPYLSTTAIVVRRGSRIHTSEFHRWGEDPSAGIMRAVALSLGAAPAILAVDVAPWPVQARHDYLVQLHVAHLEGVTVGDSTATEGEVRVTTSWEIIRSQDGRLVARGESDRRETGWKVGDYRGLVAGVDKGLAGLGRDLAACLVRIGPARPTADSTAAGPLVVCRAP